MRKFTFRTIAGLFAMSLGLGVTCAHAQAGTLDPTFGTDGIVTTSFAEGVAGVGGFEQSNGDIVVVTQADFVNNAGTGIGLARYTSAGVLDTTFGTDGITITTFAGMTFDPFGFAVQTDGDILVGGTATNSAGLNEFGLARYTSDGILDTSFGTGGLVTTEAGTRSDAPSAMLLEPNGQIVMGGLEVAGGAGAPAKMSLVRYNSDGSLDTTFGTGGISLVTDTVVGPETLALLSNGNYLAVGQNATGTVGVVVELSSKGALKPRVTPGTLAAELSSSQGGASPTVFQPNGDYIVADTTCTFHSECRGHRISMERFSETGTKDSSFNSGAFYSFNPPETTSVGLAVALQANGQILVSGSISDFPPVLGGLARLNTNGTLDNSFGNGGAVTTNENPISALLVQTDGNIVAIGANNGNLILARYLAN